MIYYLLNSIQLVVNKAMRVICKVGKSVIIADLQKITNWMSVRQAAKYQCYGCTETIIHKAAALLVRQAVGDRAGAAAWT